MKTLQNEIDELSKAVAYLEECLNEAEKIENPLLKIWEFYKLNTLKNKLRERAEMLNEWVRSGNAFK